MTPAQKATQTTIGIMSFVLILVAAAYGIGFMVVPPIIWWFINVINPWYELLPDAIQIMIWLILSMIPMSIIVWTCAWLYHSDIAAWNMGSTND